MKVTFESPLTARDNNKNIIWKNEFDPTNSNHFDLIPNEPGIYIYGIKLKCNDNIKKFNKFLPLYVGIAKDIRDRLKNNHYKGLKIDGNGRKEIFDLSNIDCDLISIKDLYNQMEVYDSFKGKNEKRYKLNRLIWFNNSTFFNSKLKLLSPLSSYRDNSGHLTSISKNGDLENIYNLQPYCKALELKALIENTKKIFTEQFYFCYAKLSDFKDTILPDNEFYDESQIYAWRNGTKRGKGMFLCENIEFTTKEELKKQFGIYTTAKAEGKTTSIQIDFSKVVHEIINLNDKNNCKNI